MLKKKISESKNDKITIKINALISVLLIVFLSFISIGFAIYNENLYFSGTTSLAQQGSFAITNVQLTDYSNVNPNNIPSYTSDSINFNLTFEKSSESISDEYMAEYTITVVNNSFYDYNCDFSGYQPVIKNQANETVDSSLLTYQIEGLEVGETIKSGETKTIIITFEFTPEDEDIYTIEGNINPDIIEKPHGNIFATIPNNTSVNLTEDSGNNLVGVPVSIISSFQSDKTITFSIANPNFVIANSDGTPFSNFIIESGETSETTIYIKLAEGVKFSVDTITTEISFTYDGNPSTSCGSITLYVDIDESYIDQTPPIISNVVAEIQNATSGDTTNNNVGSIKVNWSVDDESVDHYTVLVYSVNNSTETLLNEYTTTNKYYTINNLADGDYAFKVYGTDASANHNTASQTDINNATTSAGYCSKSTISSYDWHYTVTTTLTYVTISDTIKKVNRGYNYTTTVTKNDDTTSSSTCGGTTTTTYKLPNAITVTMNGQTLATGTASGEYQYTGSSNVSSGTITIYGVTGDLSITVTGTSS